MEEEDFPNKCCCIRLGGEGSRQGYGTEESPGRAAGEALRYPYASEGFSQQQEGGWLRLFLNLNPSAYTFQSIRGISSIQVIFRE